VSGWGNKKYCIVSIARVNCIRGFVQGRELADQDALEEEGQAPGSGAKAALGKKMLMRVKARRRRLMKKDRLNGVRMNVWKVAGNKRLLGQKVAKKRTDVY